MRQTEQPVRSAGVLQTSGPVTIADGIRTGRVAVRGYRRRGSRFFDGLDDRWRAPRPGST